MDIINVTEQSFDRAVSAGKVIADFFAPWCDPCRRMAEELEQLAKERADIRIIKVNVDDCPMIASRYEIMNIPTVLFFENGELKAKTVGFEKRSELVRDLGI